MEALFYIFCTTLPNHIISFVLFWPFPWRSRGAALVLASCNVLCKMATAAYFVANGMSFRNMELLFGAFGFLIYICLLRMDFFKLLFTSILITDYLLVVRGISSFVAVRLFQASSQGWISSFTCLLLYAFSLPLLIYLARRVANQVYNTRAPQLWRTIWLVPGLLTILTVLSTNAYLDHSALSYFFLFFRISLLICVFVIYHALLQTLGSLQKQVELEQQMIFEKRMMDLQLEEQRKYRLLIMESAEQTQRMRHDLRHQLTVIQAMAGDGDPKLTEYIASLIHTMPPAVKDYCENAAVNAIVSHYADFCQRKGIQFAARLVVPASCPQAEDSNLCVIFGNLLENAVEACQRMASGERFIHLNSVWAYGRLTITMDNSFDGKIQMESGKHRSSKRDAFGIGLSSIQAVARAHQGDARFEADGTTFSSSVYLKL